MKKTYMMALMLMASALSFAVPAQRGIYRTVTLADGTEVRVELRGDEHAAYWQADDGRKFVKSAAGDYYVTIDDATLDKRSVRSRLASFGLSADDAEAVFRGKAPSRISIGGDHPALIGSKRGLVVLVEFTDMKFREGHDAEYYSHVWNDEGFTHPDGFVGSVHDYFMDQSEGQFDLTFDVVGPVQLSHDMAYYGAHTGDRTDANVGAMVSEAVRGAESELGSFAAYDWFGDGLVDQVFVIYAGRGEATGGGDNTIWPHRSQVNPMRAGGKYVMDYACSNEMRSDVQVDGIGTFCHEFSHCLGLPDLYDVAYSGNYGMDVWDIMNSGSYLGNSFRPCAYSGYERNYCGWKTAIELVSDTVVTSVKGISEGGDFFIIRNDAHPDEYYVLENRSCTGWDSAQPGAGLLITHIDFDQMLWAYNLVNTTASGYNDHQRYTPIQADNYYAGALGDLYPYRTNNSLTNRSLPAASLWNVNSDGEKYMSKPVTDITRNDDGTISFSFANEVGLKNELPVGVVFKETFDYCAGAGGNDGLWKISSSQGDRFMPDNMEWTAENAVGADRCAIFGTDFKAGSATTPVFTITGPTLVTAKAGVYTSSGTTLSVGIATGAEVVSIVSGDSHELEKDCWNDVSVSLSSESYPAECSLKFSINRRRFFLDEVTAEDTSVTGIEYVDAGVTEVGASDAPVYNLAGQRVSPDTKGLLIRNGKKFVNK